LIQIRLDCSKFVGRNETSVVITVIPVRTSKTILNQRLDQSEKKKSEKNINLHFSEKRNSIFS